MRKLNVFLLAVAAFFSEHQHAFAWSSAGHMVIAAEAFRELSPGLKFKVSSILQAHPDYEKWVNAFGSGMSTLDLQTYIFMRAAAWPDELRKTQSLFDHPHWHYVDYALRPPNFPKEPRPKPDDDAVYGIEKCEKILCDPNASPQSQAVYLSYLIHLVGDLHQPLHCASLYDTEFPNGDHGGNDFFVRAGSKGIRLHAFWDELLGTSIKSPALLNEATKVIDDYPREPMPEMSKATTVKEWSLETRELAIRSVYLKGTLKGSKVSTTAPELPKHYARRAKTIAERQAALAGYRLADEISKCLK